MKRENIPVEFLYQLFSLVLATIIVHAFYVTAVRPQAEATLTEQRMAMEADDTYVPERSFYVLIRDFEQEACLILLIWAMSIMAFKAWRMTRERSLLQQDLIPLSEGISILPEDTREISRPVQALGIADRGLLLPRTLLTALHRFRSTRNIQDVSTSVRTACEAEAERLDSELSMVRYIAWAIPSIGFVGTVRGIGEALGQAHNAVKGDITGVTESLGVAFNSTFTALVYSILLMFLLHQLQLFQERLVIETQDYCDERLISRLQTR